MRFIILSVAVLLSSCGAPPIYMGETGNPDVKAANIAKVDGCTIWRIRDGTERTVYFARCQEGSVKTSWDEGAGKTLRHMETIGER